MKKPEAFKIITQFVNKEINQKQAIALLKSQSVGVQSSKELMTVICDKFDPLHKDLKSLFVQFSQDIHKTSNLSHPSFERRDSLRAESPDISLDSRTTAETVSDDEYSRDLYSDILEKCTSRFGQHFEMVNSFLETKYDIVHKFDKIFSKLEECRSAGGLTDYRINELIPRTLVALFEVAALSEFIVSMSSEMDRNSFIATFTNLKVEKGFTFNAKTSDELIAFIINPLFESFDKAIEDGDELLFFNSAFGSDPCFNARVSTILNYFGKINGIPDDLSLGTVKDTHLTSQLFESISNIIGDRELSSDDFTAFIDENKTDLLAPYCGLYSEDVIDNSFENALEAYRLYF
jgi:hypothetical protein